MPKNILTASSFVTAAPAHAKVEQIGDLTNQGDGKNWIYSVNGKRGEVSAGVQTLKNGDTVLWKFQEYE